MIGCSARRRSIFCLMQEICGHMDTIETAAKSVKARNILTATYRMNRLPKESQIRK